MENTVNSRVQMLKSELRLNTMDFCARAKISNGTFHNIKIGENVNQKTLNNIIENLNVNPDWLIHGKGKMFIDAPKETVSSNPWKDALISELKEEVTYYRELLKMMAGGGQSAKLKASENAYRFKMFPGMEQLNTVSGAIVR